MLLLQLASPSEVSPDAPVGKEYPLVLIEIIMKDNFGKSEHLLISTVLVELMSSAPEKAMQYLSLPGRLGCMQQSWENRNLCEQESKRQSEGP